MSKYLFLLISLTLSLSQKKKLTRVNHVITLICFVLHSFSMLLYPFIDTAFWQQYPLRASPTDNSWSISQPNKLITNCGTEGILHIWFIQFHFSIQQWKSHTYPNKLTNFLLEVGGGCGCGGFLWLSSTQLSQKTWLSTGSWQKGATEPAVSQSRSVRGL